MFNSKLAFVVKIVISFFLFVNIITATNSGKIRGIIKEVGTGEALLGANVFIQGTSLGSSTDINGLYTITNIPFGTYILKVTYIGYKTQYQKIVVNTTKTVELNFTMQPEVIEGETVTITAQREGQIAAINQQITSNSIKNIVSSDKIEELPEANAAEAVGRLPGISLQRDGGEGNKVVIRGLAPRYNKVQIDGVDMASTDSDERSSDLSMISPYMLGGIEVTKSAMANQEADQLGGTVNFILKGAPYKQPTSQLIMEGGYNALRNEYKDYRLVAQHTRRLFDNALGLSLNLDIEKRNRSSNTVSADYKYLTQDSITVVNSLYVGDITRNLERYNGSLFLDYKSKSIDITFSNMLSRIDRTTVNRNENSFDLHGSAGRSQYLNYSESNTTIIMNKLKIKKTIADINFNLGISYSYSKDNVPEEISYGGVEAAPLTGPIPYSAKPVQIPGYMKNDISTILLGYSDDSDSYTLEDEISTSLDIDWKILISDLLKIEFNIGGKYKHKSREYDYNTIYLNLSRDPSNIANQAIIEKWPWMQKYLQANSFPYQPFIDNNYDPGDFMGGEYNLERIPQFELGLDLIHYLEEKLGVDWQGASTPKRFVPNFHTSKMSDYNGIEDYYASYFMPIISYSDVLTFIPGFRYEHNTTKYTGIRGDGGKKFPNLGYVFHEKTVQRKNDYFLPMVHLRYKPLNWFDVRASYTKTLSRPGYTEFLPSWHISAAPLSIDYRNPNLKPARSENLDLYFSFYGNKIGLFTVGLFSKNIKDLIFSQKKIILNDTMAVEEYKLTEDETGFSPATFKSKPIWSFINNPNLSKVYGVEIEWQSNLWFLPGILQNIVFGINYTYTHSEVLYPRTVPIKEFVQSPFGKREIIVGNKDVPYTAPLLYQPDHILNITLGYDYKGFSIRGSMQMKSDIFSQNDWRPELRGFTDDFYLYDLSVSQKLPVEGLILFGNLKNITKTIETDVNSGTGFMSNKEYYSMNANMGIKYKF
jgi:TonB-dependent receptor